MSYSPSDTIKDAEVMRELQRVGNEFNSLGIMKVLYVEPAKPREGNFCICDGGVWNPLGDGIKRAIWFNGAAWQAF